VKAQRFHTLASEFAEPPVSIEQELWRQIVRELRQVAFESRPDTLADDCGAVRLQLE
jgi:hypothetical protein